MLSIRKEILREDLSEISRMLKSTGFFDQAPDEIDVAIELVTLSLENGNNVENYRTLIAEDEGKMVGYVCFARVPCTVSTYEMYWLCVEKEAQGSGYGRYIISAVFEEVRMLSGKKVLLQTAGREQYLPTQHFYLHCGFELEARIKDYYAEGDDCLIFSKEL